MKRKHQRLEKRKKDCGEKDGGYAEEVACPRVCAGALGRGHRDLEADRGIGREFA